MAQDYKQANDRSIADVNRLNRDAWQSGDFRHVSIDSDIQERTMRKQNNTNKVAQNAHPEVRNEFAEMQREVRSDPGGRGKAAAREYKQFAKYEGEIERVTGTKKRPNNYYNSVSGQRRMPGKRSGGPGPVDSAIPPGSTNYNQKSTAAAKRAGQVTSSSEDVRHPPKGGQEIVSGGQVVGHHDKQVHLPRTAKKTWRKQVWS
jgi:hypothetical protein